MTNKIPSQVYTEFKKFIDNFQTMIMATTSADGIPNASYAPFVKDTQGYFYIFLSGLAKHTGNLLHTQQASIMFIEDENSTKQIFARKRLTYNCTVLRIDRKSKSFEKNAQLFLKSFPVMFKQIREMIDFQMYQLKPRNGRFVIGFGQAYEVHVEKQHSLSHITGKDHQAEQNEKGKMAHQVEYKI